MRKKELWDYENKKKHKASGRSLGSHLLHALLISGCLTASATIVISLFFYFYPSEATRTALAVQGFARQLAGARESEEKPPLQSVPAFRNLQQSLIWTSGWYPAAPIRFLQERGRKRNLSFP